MLCIGATTELCAQIVRTAGSQAAVLVVSDVTEALRLLRGGGGTDAPLTPSTGFRPRLPIEFGSLRVDTGAREASWHGLPIALSARQFDLLSTLAAEGDRVWSYADLTRVVWRRNYVGDVDAVSSAIKRLRRRLADVTAELTITSVRGVGYRLALLTSPLPHRYLVEASHSPF